jgi:hypothetical protein
MAAESGLQRIRDPLHDLIELRTGTNQLEYVLWNVLQTRPFQRLRRVKQLGFSDFVYPGATHSRFAHSVGVFHTARQLMGVIDNFVPRIDQAQRNQALAAALVHDLGHGAFSHAFETVGKKLGLKMARHENVSEAIIKDSEVTLALNELGTGFASDVADVVKGEGRNSVYRAVVSSQFDADRLDYMRRDRLMSGTQHAAIDFAWLMANLEVGEVDEGVDETPLGKVATFVLGPKAVHAAEAFVLGLFQLYPTVYFHKTTRGAEKLFVELLSHTIQVVRAGNTAVTGLPENHPLVRFSLDSDNLERALDLDDSVVWGALSMMADAKDPIVSQFSVRLRDRKLFKCVDFRWVITTQMNPKNDLSEEMSERIDAACANIYSKLIEWSVDNSETFPRIICDEAARSPYKRSSESKGPLDQINIRLFTGGLVDVATQSTVVAALKPFKLNRAYYSPDDAQAGAIIQKFIKEELS